jgi:hypothetical protein
MDEENRLKLVVGISEADILSKILKTEDVNENLPNEIIQPDNEVWPGRTVHLYGDNIAVVLVDLTQVPLIV